MIYLDNNATSALDKRVYESMKPFLGKEYANPSAIYRFGQYSRSAIETAREHVAGLISSNPEEIVFTSGGTEANNMALKGVAAQLKAKGRHIISSSTEHPSVLNVCAYLEAQGYEVTYLGVDTFGCVDIRALQRALRPDTVLVSIMHANNETGTIQPIEAIAALCKEKKVLFHSDAVQTAGRLDVNVRAIGIDLLSLSAHKFYGPKGAGALFVRQGVDIPALIHGGSQEKNRRSGTENVAAIVGLGDAARYAKDEMSGISVRVKRMRDDLEKGILRAIKGAQVNGHPQNRLYNTLNVSFPHAQTETLIISLDFKGICVSGGSACASGSGQTSYVLNAMGLPEARVRSALRLSLSKYTKRSDITKTIEEIKRVVKRLQSLSSSWNS